MDDHKALVRDYEITIESMKREVNLLYDKLNEPVPRSQIQDEYEHLENSLEVYKQDIEGHTADITEERKKRIALKAEEEWVKVNSPEYQESKILNDRINELNDMVLSTKKARLETSNNISLEQIRESNPKLYNHIKRALKAEQQYLNLKEEQLRLKKERKDLRLKYYKITQAFAAEENTKQKLKEIQSVVEQKSKMVDGLTRELSELQEKLQFVKQNVQNVEVKKILFEYNEVKNMKNRLLEKKAQVKAEIEETQVNLEKMQKNPAKITPSVANQNLRKESQMLETKIIDASREVKEKEKEHLQAQFQYEEAKKQLKELQKPPEIVTVDLSRNPLSRRVTNRDLSPSSPGKRSSIMDRSIGSPGSPGRKSVAFDTSQTGSPFKRVSVNEMPFSQSSIIVESPTSPEKRQSILKMVECGMTETLTEQLARALKGVGNPGHSIASKLLSVNRGDIIKKTKPK